MSPPGSAEAASNIILCSLIFRRGEDHIGFVELDQLAEIHEGGMLRYARGLLHIMRHNRDRIFAL